MIAERSTIYVTEDDQAVGLSEWLHASDRRLGRLRPEDLDPYARELLAKRADDLAIVDARVNTGTLGHSYCHSSPAISSDKLLFLMGEPAGSARRPLSEAFPGHWILDDERYPFVGDAAEGAGTGTPEQSPQTARIGTGRRLEHACTNTDWPVMSPPARRAFGGAAPRRRFERLRP